MRASWCSAAMRAISLTAAAPGRSPACSAETSSPALVASTVSRASRAGSAAAMALSAASLLDDGRLQHRAFLQVDELVALAAVIAEREPAIALAPGRQHRAPARSRQRPARAVPTSGASPRCRNASTTMLALPVGVRAARSCAGRRTRRRRRSGGRSACTRSGARRRQQLRRAIRPRSAPARRAGRRGHSACRRRSRRCRRPGLPGRLSRARSSRFILMHAHCCNSAAGRRPSRQFDGRLHGQSASTSARRMRKALQHLAAASRQARMRPGAE